MSKLNGKTSAVTDNGVKVFDSTASLLYLAEKSGKFLPIGNRGEWFSWMMFTGSGFGPYSGQAVHFTSPQRVLTMRRYLFAAKRHYDILDAQVAKGYYLPNLAATS